MSLNCPCTLCLIPLYNFTGLMLAYKSKPDRSPNMHCPPALSPLGSFAFGQPIAPSSIASDWSLQNSNDPFGHSSPVSR